jgi:carnitine-CoA ligase
LTDLTIQQHVAQWSQRTPDRPALTGNGRTWTHADLNHDTERLGAGLRGAGLVSGDRVAVFASNHPAVVLTWLACARTGIVSSVINQFLKPQELAWVLGHLGARIAIAGPDEAETVREALRLAEMNIPVHVIDGQPGGRAFDELLEAEPDAGPHPSPDDILEITFTSGTTGNPKGAVFDHRAHIYSCTASVERYRWTAESVGFTMMPLFHAGGIRVSVLPALMVGGHAIIGQFSLTRFWDDTRTYGITHFATIDTILILLMKQERRPDDVEVPLRVGMGAGPPEVLSAFEDRFDMDFQQAYGMTECSMVLTSPAPSQEADRAALQEQRRLVPSANYVGVPLGDRTEIRLVDADGNDVPDDTVGEFVIRSPGMLREYYHDDQGTRLILRDGWLYSGDTGLRSSQNGAYYYVERSKDMIRRSGENIAPRQVEEVLVAHPGIAMAAVHPVPDELRMQAVKAVVVRAEGSAVTAEELWQWCDDRLADYKVPRYVEFVEQMPLTSTGKIVKTRLREFGITPDTFDRGDRSNKQAREERKRRAAIGS